MPPRRPRAEVAASDAPAPIPNRWTPFGLEDDPFFQEELGPRATDAYPVARYFVGRHEEVRALVHRVGGARSSRTVVEGDAGVGKTSFVNRVKHDREHHGTWSEVAIGSRADAGAGNSGGVYDRNACVCKSRLTGPSAESAALQASPPRVPGRPERNP